MADKLITLTGLWVTKSQDGKSYMQGRFGLGGKLLIFRNGKKKKDSDPDYYATIGEWVKADSDRTTRGSDDDVPF